MSVEIDDDAETGVFEPTVTVSPSFPGSLPIKFHTLCSWSLGGCPYVEMIDIMNGFAPANMLAAGQQDKIIGERNHFRVQHKFGTGGHQFQQDSSWWFVYSGDTVGRIDYEYDLTQSFLQLSPFPDGAGLQDTVRFYYTAADQYSVLGQADLSYDNDKATVRVVTKANYDVHAPTNVSMTRTIDSVRVYFGSLLFGNGGVPGISWTLSATAPTGDTGGYIAATQLAKLDWETRDFSWTQTHYLHHSDFVRDGCPIYPRWTGPSGAAQVSGGHYSWTSGDSPSAPLAATDSMTRYGGEFQTFFMYRPAGAYSIWVPLQVLDWDFTGTARNYTTGSWTLDSSAFHADSAGHPTTTFPQWSDVYPYSPCPSLPAFRVVAK